MCEKSREGLHLSVFPFFLIYVKRLIFLIILTPDDHRRAAMKMQCHRNTHRLILPAFRTCRRIKKAATWIHRQRNAHHLVPPAFRTPRQLLEKAAAMKIRRQRNAQHLKLPAFCTRRRREKLNLLKYVGVTSPWIETHGDLVGTVRVAAAHVDLERISLALVVS